MSSFGIKIENTNGEVLIDQDYRNHKLLSQGTLSIGGNGRYTYSFSSSDNAPPICMFRLPVTSGGAGTVSDIRLSGSPGAWTGIRFEADGLSGTQIHFAIFDSNGSGRDGSTHGLMVFDEDSNVVFDSGQSYLDIKNAISVVGSGGADLDRRVNFSVPHRDNYIQMHTLQGFAMRYYPPFGGGFIGQIWKYTVALGRSGNTNYRMRWKYTETVLGNLPFHFEERIRMRYMGVAGVPTL